ncbi:hypothetical protein V1521DRAFT_232255 [Lipomyces starkeyi]
MSLVVRFLSLLMAVMVAFYFFGGPGAEAAGTATNPEVTTKVRLHLFNNACHILIFMLRHILWEQWANYVILRSSSRLSRVENH